MPFMKKVPDSIVPLKISDDLIDEWIDSFDPSAKTFVANLVLNVLPRHQYDDLVAAGHGEIISLLCKHLEYFVMLKLSDMCPDSIVASIRFLPREKQVD